MSPGWWVPGPISGANRTCLPSWGIARLADLTIWQSVTERCVGSGIHRSKANKQARLLERKGFFISVAGN